MPDIFALDSGAGSVPLSQELVRIVKLPRRSWTPEESEEMAVTLTDLLKTPHGEMKLRPLQAIALSEIGTVGGLFAPMRVGSGKTLVSMLAPVVAFSERPLLIVPAKLVQKTELDREKLRRHWRLPPFLRIMSYEWLGRVQAAEALDEYKPDFIIMDECQKVKNHRAAVSRRVIRYFRTHPETKAVVLSGTITKRSLYDYAHMLRWCLHPLQTPLPLKFSDLAMWADALDERKGYRESVDPGALFAFCDDDEQKLWQEDPKQAARSGYRRRLIETEGVVASYETDIDASLEIAAVRPLVNVEVEEAFEHLREAAETPDGWPISDGLTMFRHARELALGFYYVWDPRPPRHWLDARREWCAYVRKILKHSRKLDSELQVRNWAEAQPEFIKELSDWKKVAKDFEPHTRPVWLDQSLMDWCADWGEKNKGIIWTEHQCVGEELRRRGLQYYGRKGLNQAGSPIELHKPGTPMVASIASNSEGRNLQAWNTNLITSIPPGGLQCEQLLGRTHRDGQEADEVSFDVIVTCVEHVEAFWQAVKDSKYVEASTGSPQKLLLAGINMPSADDIACLSGRRWKK